MSTPIITVYTKPNCQQCTAVKRALTKHGLAFTEDDITTPENTAAAKSLGFAAAPVTIASFGMVDGKPDEIMFAGYNPVEIDRIAERSS
jgi:glutaredoxin-like protein NrdH